MQQNPNPQQDDIRPHTKSKRARPYTIEARVLAGKPRTWGDWYTYGRYRTERERDQALETYQRNNDAWNEKWQPYIDYRVGSTDE